MCSLPSFVSLFTSLSEIFLYYQKNTPSDSCGINEFEIHSRFTNFTCPNKSAVSPEIASAYFTCVASLLFINILDISAGGKKNNCSTVDYDSVGKMFADCQWCTEKYGCFQVGGPFISQCHPVSLPPQPQPCLDLQLQLYTQLNPESPQLLNINLSNILQTNFNKNLKTMVLIGGWIEGDFQPYTRLLINAALNLGNFNVILFNWNWGSWTLYPQAVANTRLLGRMLAYILRDLQTQLNYSLADVHLVGNSLGAQLAGYAGKDLRSLGNYTIGRITGLDPAGSYFDCVDGAVRLTATDATFVDVIHTDTGGFGDTVTNGDIDFWPNGGEFQPGCSFTCRLVKPLIPERIFCEHTKSIYYFAYSMYSNSSSDNGTFQAYMCASYEDFKAGKCDCCGQDGSQCARMGYFANEYFEAGYQLVPASQSFYLDWLENPPYWEDLAN